MRPLLSLVSIAALVIGGIVLSLLTQPPAPALPWEVPLTFGPGDIGGPGSRAAAELRLPAGPGPYPLVVILPGCGGVTKNELDWSERLAGWGYAAAIIEPFRHRRLLPSCDRPRVDVTLRALDAFNLVDALRTRPEFAGQPVGVMGISNGGRAALYAGLEGGIAGRPSPFKGVVAYYPPCLLPNADSRFAVDAQVFVGSADYPRIVRACRAMELALAGTPTAPKVKFYPHAEHMFDTPKGNKAAAADAFAVTKSFFDARLKVTK